MYINKINILKIFLVAFAIIFFIIPYYALAVSDNNTLLAQASQTTTRDPKNGFVICGNDVNNPCNVSHLFKITIMIINYMIGMAGFLAVAFIVYAGILMTTSQGQGQLTDAKQRLTGAVIGLAIVATAFVLVNAAFTGSLNLGVKNGALIFTDPKQYINSDN